MSKCQQREKQILLLLKYELDLLCIGITDTARETKNNLRLFFEKK